MATRSAIGYRQPSGKVRAVYCHWDGYPSHQLPILEARYNTLAKVKALIKPGYISCLRTRNTWRNGKALQDANGDYIRDAEGYICSQYDRDPQPLYYCERGDNDKPVTSSNPRETWFARHDCEFLYSYEEGNGWQVVEAYG